jgi:hypothetical protein
MGGGGSRSCKGKKKVGRKKTTTMGCCDESFADAFGVR